MAVTHLQPSPALRRARVATSAIFAVHGAVAGTFASWPRGQLLPKPMPIRVKYGQPLELSNLKAADIIKIIDAEIRRLFEEIRHQ